MASTATTTPYASGAYENESDELRSLRTTLRKLLASASAETVVREQMESPDGFDRAVWRRLGTEIGVPGLAVPEQYGGAGCGIRELVVAAEEMGRVLFPSPFLSTVLLGTSILTRSEDPRAMAAHLPGIVEGSVVCSVALPGHGAGWDPRDTTVSATRTASGEWQLTGVVPHVLDGRTADLILVPARHDGVISVFAHTPDASSTDVEPLPTLDRTRRLARLSMSSAPATMIGGPGVGPELIEHGASVGAVGLAAEQVGGALRMLEVTTEHARARHQFGRPIGSFQAVKHILADMLIATELAAAALHDAVRAVEDDDPDADTAVSVAKVVCSETYYDVAASAIQLHGGLGFTWEHSAHLYFKRATGDRILLGSPQHHLDRLSAGLRL